MMNKQPMASIIFCLALFLGGFCLTLQAHSQTITAITEAHTRSQGADTAEKKQPWQTVNLSIAPTAGSTVLGWRHWGGQAIENAWAHYDGSQVAVWQESGRGAISDVLDYEPNTIYIGRDSYFFINYKDPKTGNQAINSRTFVFTFDTLTFSVSADNQPKVLRLWMGTFACNGVLEADLLSAAGEVLASYATTLDLPTTSDASQNGFLYGYCRLRFQGTAPGQSLRVRLSSANPLLNSANVLLQAACVTTVPPVSR